MRDPEDFLFETDTSSEVIDAMDLKEAVTYFLAHGCDTAYATYLTKDGQYFASWSGQQSEPYNTLEYSVRAHELELWKGILF